MTYDFPPHIINNKDFLQKISKTRSEHRKNKYLEEATFEQILALVEIIRNILKGNISLHKKRRKHLSQFADYYRAVSNSRSEQAARRKLQSGGAIPIAAIIAPVIGAIAQHILDKTLNLTEQ
ncbi:MAG TPA: hypothetical protein VJS91_00730 [Nitrososphaeraceae archaeon]|nr:hypothetical protein [Nitrososphaeraceae archaeon]